MANIRFCRLCCEKSIERPIKRPKNQKCRRDWWKTFTFFSATSKVPVEGVSTELNSGMWGGEKFAEAPHGVGTLSVKTSPSLEAGRPFQVKHCCTIFFCILSHDTFSLWPFFYSIFWSDRLHFIAAEQALKVLEKFFFEPLKNHLNGGLFFPQPLISPCNLHFLHLHLHCQMLQFALFVSPW